MDDLIKRVYMQAFQYNDIMFLKHTFTDAVKLDSGHWNYGTVH